MALTSRVPHSPPSPLGCCYKKANPSRTPNCTSDLSPCDRRVLWRVDNVGRMCSFHYELYMDTHPDVGIDAIHRLSDDDRAFVTRCEPGRSRQRGSDGGHKSAAARRAQA